MSRASRRLPRSFYEKDVLEVATKLLNKVVVSERDGLRLAARIVEVEAYRGAEDEAAHSFRGPTKRNATMFGPPGHWYVYFSYGMHWCANLVVAPAGTPHAVLVRAAEPLEGFEVMRERRPKARTDRDLLRGPGRFGSALGFTGADDGLDAVNGPIRVVDDGVAPPERPAIGPRVGITKAAEEPWRFWVPESRFVSATRRATNIRPD